MNTDLWYFAHPYSVWKDGERDHEAEKRNFELCNVRAAVLLELRYNIVSPISHSYSICQALPNGDGFDWYALDNLIIAKTDFRGIILAPGWENSKGCVDEKERFESLAKEVLLFVDITKQWFKENTIWIQAQILLMGLSRQALRPL